MAEWQDQSISSAEENFQLEIKWCIYMLELQLDSGKRDPKEVAKYIKTLKSSKVVPVKKRTLMKSLFRDYRGDMKKQEKEQGLTASKVKFLKDPEKDNKSKFIKTAAILRPTKSNDYHIKYKTAEAEKYDFSPGDFHFPPVTKFRFNFGIEEEGDIDFSSLVI